jgi:hypothetical protein
MLIYRAVRYSYIYVPDFICVELVTAYKNWSKSDNIKNLTTNYIEQSPSSEPYGYSRSQKITVTHAVNKLRLLTQSKNYGYSRSQKITVTHAVKKLRLLT